MRDLVRPALIVAAALAAPVVPFLLLGDRLDERIADWLNPDLSLLLVWALIVGVLASDIVLPMPSSLVSTFGGAQIGVIQGTLASWIGLMLGCVVGFAVARWLGRPMAVRFSRPDDLTRLEQLAERHGVRMLVMLRAVPLLAEASVLVLGVTRMPWRQFLLPLAVSNLGVAAAYSAFGAFAKGHNALPAALIASVALPVAAGTMARRFLPAKTTTDNPSDLPPSQPAAPHA